ncbi:MAG TPA: class I SAM-dependent methyltransferase, partial [Kiloniellaceae bacterium]|nr:class I SAM-dependent methyltransferase [Kiloniellaceae bacterium]
GGRRNAACPTCGSLERHRLLWVYLTRHTTLLRQLASILHVAPEPCLESNLRPLPNLHYCSLDLYNPAADVHADLCRLPFPAARFDLAICSHVLEHLPNDRRAIGELARVLRRGGRALILVPFDRSLPATLEDPGAATAAQRLARFGHPFHYRSYGADFAERLAAAGFAVSPIWSRRLLTPHKRRRLRINDNHLFDCRRL